MNNALIGYSGFVGSTLLKQTHFQHLYRSTNIADIEGCEFDMVVCAGAPAQKWIANKDPDTDLEAIEKIINHLKKIKCKTFVLISTVDVFKSPNAVDELTPVDEAGLQPYGLHRRYLEKFIEQYFDNYLIVRLPGLVGPGLRKNIIYDFLNKNNLQSIESRSVFQFYPMVNLWFDIQTALNAHLKLVHLTAEPISVRDISLQGFGSDFTQEQPLTPAHYDMRTCHASLYQAHGHYQYSVKDTINAVRHYAQSESLTTKN